jgi:SAM-dependent methyltransferase
MLNRVRAIGRPRRPRLPIRLTSHDAPSADVENYFLPAAYQVRAEPLYYLDSPPTGVTYQPDVYRLARKLARRAGAATIVDVGCGSGEKLASLASDFRVIGVDFGKNVERASARLPEGTWIQHDLESESAFPVGEGDLRRSVVICADVVEHLRDPSPLLRALRKALLHAHGAIISTPDRTRLSGGAPNGPPTNPSHVREWTREEFASLLVSEGLRHGIVTFTRPHTGTLARSTILGIVVPPGKERLLRRSTWVLP